MGGMGGKGRARGECSSSIGNAGGDSGCHESIRLVMVDGVVRGSRVSPDMDNRVARVMA